MPNTENYTLMRNHDIRNKKERTRMKNCYQMLIKGGKFCGEELNNSYIVGSDLGKLQDTYPKAFLSLSSME